MDRKIITIAAVFGAIAIVLGAFCAHGLKQLISPESLVVFETGVKYQMYHALLLLFLGTTPLVTEKAKNTILKLVVFGVVLFSGSVYFLACNVLFSFDFKKIGIITPIGGLLLIAGWLMLFLHLIKQKR